MVPLLLEPNLPFVLALKNYIAAAADWLAAFVLAEGSPVSVADEEAQIVLAVFQQDASVLDVSVLDVFVQDMLLLNVFLLKGFVLAVFVLNMLSLEIILLDLLVLAVFVPGALLVED